MKTKRTANILTGVGAGLLLANVILLWLNNRGKENYPTHVSIGDKKE